MKKKLSEEQELLIETSLIDAFKAFHDLDDRLKRESYCKEYFDEFVEKTKVDPVLTIEKLKEYFEHRRQVSIFDYKYYEKDELYRICKVKKPNKNKAESHLEDKDSNGER